MLLSGWHSLEAIVSPGFLIIAQMSPTYICYFSSKNYFLSQAHFSDSGVDYDIILRHEKNKNFLLPYMCLWLKHLQALPNI